MQDLKYALRTLTKNPLFTTVVVLTLALGIGANTTIFTMVNSVVLRPLPYPEPQELAFLNERNADFDGMSVSWPNFVDWRERNRTFEALTAFRGANYNLTGGDQPVRLEAQQATHELFEILNASFAVGRAYGAAEDRPGAPPTAVLSYGLWTTRFGQDPAVVGSSLTLDGQSYEVVGVAGPAFDPKVWGRSYELWTPLGLRADEMTSRGNHPGIYVIGRLRDGSTLDQAVADMDSIARNLQQEYPDSNAGNLVRIRALHEALVGTLGTPMKLLLGAVGFVLLIVCANVANLLLARATGRRAEAAVRAAMGARRGRLIAQYLIESLVLAGAGAALGLAAAAGAVRLLVANLPEGLPRADSVTLDWTALAFTAGIALISAIIFGLAPAIHGTRINLNDALRDGGRGAGVGRHPLRAALVITETALALILLIGSALMMRSFWNVLEADPGFDPDNLLTIRFSLPEEPYEADEGRGVLFVDELVRQVAALPGVMSAGVTNPLLGGYQTGAHPEGYPEPQPGEYTPVDYAAVTPNHLQTMQVNLIEGRHFTEFDKESVLIVDETFAEKYWPGESAVGKRVKVGGFRSEDDYSEIVGVVSHVKNYGVDEESRIEMYLPYKIRPFRTFTLAVRTQGDPDALAAPVRQVVRNLDAQLPVFGVQSMKALLGERVAPRRLAATLMALFAGAALLLAALGIYGVMSYNVSQRSREVGLRMALGAQRASVLSLVVGQASRLVAAGLVIGVGAALVLSRFVDSMLFGVAATDALSYVGVALLLAGVGVLASLLPALRASRVDPMEALRYE